MPRGILSLAVALWMGAGALDVAAQEEPMARDRPDSQAPAGVVLDHLRAPGELELRYRLDHQDLEGIFIGKDEIPMAMVLQEFDAAPVEGYRQSHVLELQYGALDRLTVGARVPLVVTDAVFTTTGMRFGNDNHGIGDVEAYGLISLYESGGYRTHVSAGVSFPTGETGATGPAEPNQELTGVLPYAFQTGSGTFDLLPGATLVAMNEFGTVGLQGRGVIRLGENDRDYTLGNRVLLTGWGAYRFTDWISGSLRVQWQTWGNPEGVDPELDPWSTPMAHPVAQGGSRLDLPIGVNVHFRDGLLQGHRVTGEFVVPVEQDLDGPQLGVDWGLNLSWSYAF